MTTGQGLLPYTIEVVDDDTTLTGHAGLPLVLETMRALGVSEVLDGALGIRRRNHGATDAQKAEALVLLMAAGGDSVDDIEVLRADKGLQRLSGSLPSADVLLTFLHAFHDERLIEQAQRDRSVPRWRTSPRRARRSWASRAPSDLDPWARGTHEGHTGDARPRRDDPGEPQE